MVSSVSMTEVQDVYKRQDMRYIIETTKTDAGTRLLPITEDVAPVSYTHL